MAGSKRSMPLLKPTVAAQTCGDPSAGVTRAVELVVAAVVSCQRMPMSSMPNAETAASTLPLTMTSVAVRVMSSKMTTSPPKLIEAGVEISAAIVVRPPNEISAIDVDSIAEPIAVL